MENTRVTFADLNADNTVTESEILQQNHYYPFGMNMEGAWSGGTNKYQYNGKEIDNEFGLDWYHYGARMYDATIGRFTGVDPIADQFAWVSTYNYAENEPIANIDLHGLQKFSFQNLVNMVTEYFGYDESTLRYGAKDETHASKISENRSDFNEFVDEGNVRVGDGLMEMGGEINEFGDALVLASATTNTVPNPVSSAGMAIGETVSVVGLGMKVTGDIVKDGKLNETTNEIIIEGISAGVSGLAKKGLDSFLPRSKDRTTKNIINGKIGVVLEVASDAVKGETSDLPPLVAIPFDLSRGN